MAASIVGIIGLVLGGGSLLMSAKSGSDAKKAAQRQADLEREAGDARNAAAQLEADVLDRQATQTVAVAQRDMFDVQRQARLAASRALSLSAASGGGASAPTVLNVVGNIAKEGAYNAARALYAGEEQARLMRIQAIEKRKLGQFDLTAGNLAGLASESRGRAAQSQSYANILSTVGGLYGKYGGGTKGTGTTAGSGVDIGDTGAGDIPSTSSYG